ncbi:MAG: ABC transporter substrate-binding protein [Acidobacteriota bacterium]|nr:ABC transporter substrate-binding protein [Acidobacteriota bacterium]MDH3785758.1 ABC transporter substrate-binding protein [Acidobacteriota bacterium]
MASRAIGLLLAAGLLFVGSSTIRAGESGEADRGEPQQVYARTPDKLVPYSRSGNPYRQFYLTAPVFRGEGREGADPAGVSTVRIGLLAPLHDSPDVAAGSSLRRGVELALDEANHQGAYQGIPFELVLKNDQALWGSSSNTLVELAYTDRVWAVIGSVDPNSTHVALRVALKTELPIVNVGSTDPTMTETGIPWIVRITPDDRQSGYRIASLIFEEKGLSRVAVIRSSDRYGRFGIKEFRDGARRLGRPLPMELLVNLGQRDFSSQLDRLADSGAEAVVLWVKAAEAGRIVRQMAERGMNLPVVGTDRIVSEEFLELAGEAGEGAEAAFWMNPGRQDPGWLGFTRRYRERFGADPDAFAAYGYDAARLVFETVRTQGLNRARIRDGLSAVREYDGVTGTIHLDATSNNVSPVVIAKVVGGRFVFR